MTQAQKIVDYMQRFGSITTMEAFMDLGIARLASRIYDLKCEGYQIESDMVSKKNRYGENVKYARYWIKEN